MFYAFVTPWYNRRIRAGCDTPGCFKNNLMTPGIGELFPTLRSTYVILDFAIDTARRAGALLLASIERQRTLELKSPFELVTDADHASEELIVAAIRQRFPDHTILAEEGSGVERESAYTWLVDPLD